MRVAVTGGLGVNGAPVVGKLVEEGHDVVVIDTRDDRSLLITAADKVKVEVADISDLTALGELLGVGKFDVIVHMAAVMPETCQENPYLGYSVNAQGTVAVLEAARRASVRRVVLTSSRAVFAPVVGRFGHPTYDPIDESYPRDPLPAMHVYGWSKVLSEAAGKSFSAAYGIEFVSLRFGTIYGPGKQARHGAIAVHSKLIEGAAVGDTVHIPTGGDQADDMIYVGDVARAVALAVDAEELPSDSYNIGSGRASTLKDLCGAIRNVVTTADVSVGPGLDCIGYGPLYCLFDNSLAEAELGYRPAFDLEAGVADYLRRFRADLDISA
jgi:UDP-glucose 4-epimerase